MKKKLLKLLFLNFALASLCFTVSSCDDSDSSITNIKSGVVPTIEQSNDDTIIPSTIVESDEDEKISLLNNVKNDALNQKLSLKVRDFKLPNSNDKCSVDFCLNYTNDNHLEGRFNIDYDYSDVVIDYSNHGYINDGYFYLVTSGLSKNEVVSTEKITDFYNLSNFVYKYSINEVFEKNNLNLTETEIVNFYKNAINYLKELDFNASALEYFNFTKLEDGTTDIRINSSKIDDIVDKAYHIYYINTIKEIYEMLLGLDSYQNLNTTLLYLLNMKMSNVKTSLASYEIDLQEVFPKLDLIFATCENEALLNAYNTLKQYLISDDYANKTVYDLLNDCLFLFDDTNNPLYTKEQIATIIKEKLDEYKDKTIANIIEALYGADFNTKINIIYEKYKLLSPVIFSNLKINASNENKFNSLSFSYPLDDTNINFTIENYNSLSFAEGIDDFCKLSYSDEMLQLIKTKLISQGYTIDGNNATITKVIDDYTTTFIINLSKLYFYYLPINGDSNIGNYIVIPLAGDVKITEISNTKPVVDSTKKQALNDLTESNYMNDLIALNYGMGVYQLTRDKLSVSDIDLSSYTIKTGEQEGLPGEINFKYGYIQYVFNENVSVLVIIINKPKDSD